MAPPEVPGRCLEDGLCWRSEVYDLVGVNLSDIPVWCGFCSEKTGSAIRFARTTNSRSSTTAFAAGSRGRSGGRVLGRHFHEVTPMNRLVAALSLVALALTISPAAATGAPNHASARLDPGTARAPDHGRAVCLPLRQPELVPAGGLWPRALYGYPSYYPFGATGPVYGRYSWDYNVYFAAGLGWYQEYLPHFPYPMYQPASYYLQYPTSSYNQAWKGFGW